MSLEKLLRQKGCQFIAKKTLSSQESLHSLWLAIEKDRLNKNMRAWSQMCSDLPCFLKEEVYQGDRPLPKSIADGVHLALQDKSALIHAELIKIARNWHSVALLRALAKDVECEEFFAMQPGPEDPSRLLDRERMREVFSDPRWFCAIDSLGWFSLKNPIWRDQFDEQLSILATVSPSSKQTKNRHKIAALVMHSSFRQDDAQQLSNNDGASIAQKIGALIQALAHSSSSLTDLMLCLQRDSRWNAWMEKETPLKQLIKFAMEEKAGLSRNLGVWEGRAKRAIEQHPQQLEKALKQLWKGACVEEPAAWLVSVLPRHQINRKTASSWLIHWSNKKDLSVSLRESQQLGVLLGRSGVEVVNDWSAVIQEALTRPLEPRTEAEKAMAASATLPEGVFSWLDRVKPRCIVALAHAIQELQRIDPMAAAQLQPLSAEAGMKAWVLSSYEGDPEIGRFWLQNRALSSEAAESALQNALKGLQSQKSRLMPKDGTLSTREVEPLLLATQTQWHQAERWNLAQAIHPEGADEKPDFVALSHNPERSSKDPGRRRVRML